MYLDDAPIGTIRDDRLDRDEFVGRLAKTIRSWTSDESLVIGLHGPWGSGKSSVLNLLAERLNSAKEKAESQPIIVVRFDPWFFNSSEELLRTFFGIVEDRAKELVEGGTDRRELEELVKRYAAKLSFEPKISLLGGMVSIGAGVKRGEAEKDSPERLRQAIVQSLKKVSGRLVVLVDNLDRLDPAELLFVLKLVRLCSDFPHFTYVLAFDQEQIMCVLRQQLELDVEYLAKIIQVDVNLPQIDQAQIDQFIGVVIDDFEKAYELHFEEDISLRYGPIYQESIRGTLIGDLRTAKRYLNAVAFSMPLVRGEVTFADFLTLECIRVFFPTVHQELGNYEDALTSYDTSGGSDFRRRERHGAFKALIEWINAEVARNTGDEQAAARRSASLRHMLGELFPTLGAYMSNPNNPSYITASQFAANNEKAQRVCSASHFSRYFKLRVPSSEIPTLVVREFLVAVGASTDDEIDGIQESFKDYSRRKMLVRLLQKISLYANDLDVHAKRRVVRALSAMAGELDWKHRVDFLTEAQAALLLVFDHLLPKDDSNRVLEILGEMVATSSSLAFAAAVVQVANPAGESRKAPADIEFGVLVEELRDRITAELVRPSANLYELYPNSHGPVIGAWTSSTAMNDRKGMDEYVQGLLQRQPEVVVAILADYVSTYMGTGAPADFQYAEVTAMFDAEVLYRALKGGGRDAAQGELDSFAVREFERRYETREGAEPVDAHQALAK